MSEVWFSMSATCDPLVRIPCFHIYSTYPKETEVLPTVATNTGRSPFAFVTRCTEPHPRRRLYNL